MFMLIMALSIWTSGIYYNSSGIGSDQLRNLRISGNLPLPVLMAGFRSFKFLTFFSYCACFWTISLSDESLNCIIQTIIIGCILLAFAKILTSLGFFDLSLSYGETYGQYIGPRILGHTKANMARLIFVGLLLCFTRIEGKRIFSTTLSIVILTGGLVLSGSRGGIGALIISLIPIYFLGRVRGFLIGGFAFTVIILSALVALSQNQIVANNLIGTFDTDNIGSASLRLPIWTETLSVMSNNTMILLFGVGAFNFSYSGLTQGFETAHNDLLTLGFELGLVSMMVFLTWIFSLALTYYRIIGQSTGMEKWKYICFFSIIIGLFFSSQFEATFYPTISTLPMSQIIYPLMINVAMVKRRTT
jgi:O-antigen ligase